MTIKSHYELLDEVCERLGADEIFLVRGKHTEDVESTRKVILTPGRKQAIEVAETFVMVGSCWCKLKSVDPSSWLENGIVSNS